MPGFDGSVLVRSSPVRFEKALTGDNVLCCVHPHGKEYGFYKDKEALVSGILSGDSKRAQHCRASLQILTFLLFLQSV